MHIYLLLNVTFDGIKISSIFDLENAYFSIVCKLEFGGISTFVRIVQLENAFSHIIETFDRIEISLRAVFENANLSIVCKLDFSEKSIFISLMQYSNAHDEIILIFDGIENSLISRRTNKRMSNSSLFESLFPIKYLSSINLN